MAEQDPPRRGCKLPSLLWTGAWYMKSAPHQPDGAESSLPATGLPYLPLMGVGEGGPGVFSSFCCKKQRGFQARVGHSAAPHALRVFMLDSCNRARRAGGDGGRGSGRGPSGSEQTPVAMEEMGVPGVRGVHTVQADAKHLRPCHMTGRPPAQSQ